MKRFFSHLPAWVEASACGIWRASASIMVMACSAVVMELPNGVFITMMPLAVAAGISTLSTPMPARPITFRFLARSRIFGVTLVAERMASPSKSPIDLGKLVLVLAEVGLEIDLDAAILEDLHGGGREGIGDENLGMGMICSNVSICLRQSSSAKADNPVTTDVRDRAGTLATTGPPARATSRWIGS